MDLSCIQEAMKNYLEKDKQRGLHATFTWFIEEVGELAEAILKEDPESIKEEAADVLAWLLSIMNLLGVDMEEALIKKYRRDLESTGCFKSSP